MTKPEHLRFRKGDVLAIVLVAVLAAVVAVCFLPKPQTGPVQAQIYQEGILIQTLPLDADTTFEVRGKYTNTVTVKDGSISITQAGKEIKKAAFETVPERIYWPRLVKVFEREGIAADATAKGLVLSW